MRPKVNCQPEFDLHPSNLKVTNEYYENYERASRVLDENPEIVDLVHRDLKHALESASSVDGNGGKFEYTSDTVLRILMCQIIEGLSLRHIVIRIDDGPCLRRFVRIYSGPMMDFTTLCKLKNCISAKTWEKVNDALALYAVEESLIAGERLRMDTTVVETNIHYPTDSSLLWDTYRVISRLIEEARGIDPAIVGDRRLQTRKAKRLYTKIARKATKKPGSEEAIKPEYERLIGLTTNICEWGDEVRQKLERGCHKGCYSAVEREIAAVIANEIAHYHHLGLRVIDQAARRVLDGQQVPNEQKVVSIFEPHTELLRRGKAAKPNEFGHMIHIQQVEEKFITAYEVFEKKPIEHELLQTALDSHEKLFGQYPDSVATDKGYYESMAVIKQLEKQINVVSIAKKGRRTEEEALRESDPVFCIAQRFRAGVEGSISYLKRILGLFRCFNKGWEHYAATIGAAIFTHNVLILTRI